MCPSQPPAPDPLTYAVAQRDAGAHDLVREALQENRTMLAFQPVVQTQHPDRPAFYEGLIRVCDATGRIIPARDFISEVEENELGRQLDCRSLQLGLKTLADHPGLRLSINMSARSIGYAPWVRALRRGLRHDTTIGERLILEITERSAIEAPDIVGDFMTELQAEGICFALDDFGSGYSSLQYLRDFYFDILKIDGQFIRGLERSPDNQVLVRAMMSIAEHFGMLTVAEFVETDAQANFLRDLGVDCMQGYYFGIPSIRPHWLKETTQDYP